MVSKDEWALEMKKRAVYFEQAVAVAKDICNTVMIYKPDCVMLEVENSRLVPFLLNIFGKAATLKDGELRINILTQHNESRD